MTNDHISNAIIVHTFVVLTLKSHIDFIISTVDIPLANRTEASFGK
jgi:hypothetical protein